MATILLLIILILLTTVYVYSVSKYKEEIKQLNKKEYKLATFLSFGLLIVDSKIFNDFAQKENQLLLNLYTKREYHSKKRYYEAERITLLIFIFYFTILGGLLYNMNYLNPIKINEIKRPEFLEGSYNKELSYQIKIDDKQLNYNYNLKLPEVEGNEEEIKLYLEEVGAKLEKIILNGNESIDNIKSNINLPQKYNFISIEWISEYPTVIDEFGTIDFTKISGEKLNLILEANLSYKNLTYSKKIPITIIKKDISIDEKEVKILNEINNVLSEKNIKEQQSDVVYLPTNVDGIDAEIIWFDKRQPFSAFSIVITGLIIGLLFYYFKNYELKDQINKRNDELLKDFPSFVNKLSLLMNAGMTFRRAWVKVAQDYRKDLENGSNKKILYEEVVEAVYNMEKGVPEIKAYESFGQRCKIPEILRFTSIVLQSIKKGSSELLDVLSQYAKEALLLRENNARKKGEKASTKLVLPMGIMFIAIMIIVMAPAVLSLKI